MPRNHPEDDEQRALFQWAQHIPEVRDHLFAIPNGGKRSRIEAARLVGLGVRAGVWDLFLPIVGEFPGLWIEMKSAKGIVTVKQTEWGRLMGAQGYETGVCYSADEAIGRITVYMEGAKKWRELQRQPAA